TVFFGNAGVERQIFGRNDLIGIDIVPQNVGLPFDSRLHSSAPIHSESLSPVADHCPGSDAVARIADYACNRAGRDGERAGQEYLRLFMSHAAWEVAVGRADAANRSIQPAKRVAGSSETGRAGRLADLGAGVQEHLLERVAVQSFLLEPGHDIAGCR